MRKKLSIPESAPVIVYAAEFSKRKNHMELIRAFESVIKARPDAILLLCGTGMLQTAVEQEVGRLGLTRSVRFAGWCGQMEKIYQAADLSVTSSLSEGLPFNVAESQLCGIPVIASSIRGHTDMIADGVTGWLYPSGSPEALAEKMKAVLLSRDMGRTQGIAAAGAAERFILKHAYEANTEVYRQYMK
jgi:glycosyltransferase EpsD